MILAACDHRQAPTPGDAAIDRGRPVDTGNGDGPLKTDLPTAMDAKTNPGLFAKLFIKQLYANCMPSVPPDPVSLGGHIEFLNSGAIAVGPIKLTGGSIVWPAGGAVGTFDVKPIAAHVIKPGEGLAPKVEKVPGTLKVASPCGLCGKTVRVVVAYEGAGIPAGSKLTSADVKMSCAY